MYTLFIDPAITPLEGGFDLCFTIQQTPTVVNCFSDIAHKWPLKIRAYIMQNLLSKLVALMVFTWSNFLFLKKW